MSNPDIARSYVIYIIALIKLEPIRNSNSKLRPLVLTIPTARLIILIL
jgi:hypothetical protein